MLSMCLKYESHFLLWQDDIRKKEVWHFHSVRARSQDSTVVEKDFF